MRWQLQSNVIGFKERTDGLSLAITLTEAYGQWAIVAIESPTRRPRTGPRTDAAVQEAFKEDIAQIFDNHAHQALEPQPSLDAAIALAEKYAAWWVKSKATHEECPCEDVPALHAVPADPGRPPPAPPGLEGP